MQRLRVALEQSAQHVKAVLPRHVFGRHAQLAAEEVQCCVQDARRDDRGARTEPACHGRKQHTAEKCFFDESDDQAGEQSLQDHRRQLAIDARLDLPHIERQQQRDQAAASGDAGGPAEPELTEELASRQSVTERGAVRQPQPASQHDESDERDQHRQPVHHAVHRLDEIVPTSSPGRISKRRGRDQGHG